MNKQEGAMLVGMIASAYPNWNPTKETVALYVSLLEDLEFEESKEAVKRLLMGSQFAPSIAAIRKKVLELDGAALTKSEAWELVNLFVKRNGTYNRPKFEDPVIQQVVDSLGWYEICTTTNLDTMRAHFLRLYEEMSEKVTTERLESRAFILANYGIEGVKARAEIEA